MKPSAQTIESHFLEGVLQAAASFARSGLDSWNLCSAVVARSVRRGVGLHCSFVFLHSVAVDSVNGSALALSGIGQAGGSHGSLTGRKQPAESLRHAGHAATRLSGAVRLGNYVPAHADRRRASAVSHANAG